MLPTGPQNTPSSEGLLFQAEAVAKKLAAGENLSPEEIRTVNKVKLLGVLDKLGKDYTVRQVEGSSHDKIRADIVQLDQDLGLLAQNAKEVHSPEAIADPEQQGIIVEDLMLNEQELKVVKLMLEKASQLAELSTPHELEVKVAQKGPLLTELRRELEATCQYLEDRKEFLLLQRELFSLQRELKSQMGGLERGSCDFDESGLLKMQDLKERYTKLLEREGLNPEIESGIARAQESAETVVRVFSRCLERARAIESEGPGSEGKKLQQRKRAEFDVLVRLESIQDDFEPASVLLTGQREDLEMGHISFASQPLEGFLESIPQVVSVANGFVLGEVIQDLHQRSLLVEEFCLEFITSLEMEITDVKLNLSLAEAKGEKREIERCKRNISYLEARGKEFNNLLEKEIKKMEGLLEDPRFSSLPREGVLSYVSSWFFRKYTEEGEREVASELKTLRDVLKTARQKMGRIPTEQADLQAVYEVLPETEPQKEEKTKSRRQERALAMKKSLEGMSEAEKGRWRTFFQLLQAGQLVQKVITPDLEFVTTKSSRDLKIQAQARQEALRKPLEAQHERQVQFIEVTLEDKQMALRNMTPEEFEAYTKRYPDTRAILDKVRNATEPVYGKGIRQVSTDYLNAKLPGPFAAPQQEQLVEREVVSSPVHVSEPLTGQTQIESAANSLMESGMPASIGQYASQISAESRSFLWAEAQMGGGEKTRMFPLSCLALATEALSQETPDYENAFRLAETAVEESLFVNYPALQLMAIILRHAPTEERIKAFEQSVGGACQFSSSHPESIQKQISHFLSAVSFYESKEGASLEGDLDVFFETAYYEQVRGWVESFTKPELLEITGAYVGEWVKRDEKTQFILDKLQQWAWTGEWKDIAFHDEAPWKKLEELGIDIQLDESMLQMNTILPDLVRYADSRWSYLLSEEKLEKHMVEVLERRIFSHPQVIEALQAKDSPEFREKMAKVLNSKELALFTAVMMIQNPDLPPYRRTQAHAELVRVFSKMIENNSELSSTLLESKGKVIIVPSETHFTDECQKHQILCASAGTDTYGLYAHSRESKNVFIGEERLWGWTEVESVREGEALGTTSSHELAHLIDYTTVPKNVRARVQVLYKQKMREYGEELEGWKFSEDAYAAVDPAEYFAEMSNFYFEANSNNRFKEYKGDLVVGRENLKMLSVQDQEMYTILDKIYRGAAPILYTNPGYY